MPWWLHIVMVIGIMIYSTMKFIKDKHAFHIIIDIWAGTSLLMYVYDDPTFLRILGYSQIVMFIVVIYLMFKRRGERRMSTLELMAKMSADRLPDYDNVEQPKKPDQADGEQPTPTKYIKYDDEYEDTDRL